MVLDCIETIKAAAKTSPQELYANLVQERLQLAVKSYYADLIAKSNMVENRAEVNSVTTMKRLLK